MNKIDEIEKEHNTRLISDRACVMTILMSRAMNRDIDNDDARLIVDAVRALVMLSMRHKFNKDEYVEFFQSLADSYRDNVKETYRTATG